MKRLSPTDILGNGTFDRHRRRLLVGSAGTATAFNIITALQRNWMNVVHVVAQDTNPAHLVTASILCDEFIQCPASHSVQFPEFLMGIFEAYSIEYYFPLLPSDISLMYCHPEIGRQYGVSVINAGQKAPVDLNDKWLTAQWSKSNQLPIPFTLLNEIAGSAGEYFVKPRYGVGSRDAIKLSREAVITQLSNRQNELLVQQVCDEPEVTVDVFAIPTERYVHAICRERLEIKSGVSTKARLFHDDELTELGLRIAEVFNFNGTYCFQVMRLDGHWVITDLNPRPGGGTSMSQVVGSDFAAAMLAFVWAEDYRRFLKPLAKSVYVTRQYVDFLQG